MSTSFEKIFNEVTILQAYVLQINDQELLNEDVISLELSYSFDKAFVEGTLILKDSFGIADLNLFDGNTTIKLYARDFFGEIYNRTFRITSINNDEYGERFKKYSINIVDEIYYTLANTYLSKSFIGNPITALEKYLEEVEMPGYFNINKYISDKQLIKDFDSFNGEDYSFVVPQDRSLLNFMIYELNKNGYRFWQSRKQINIKDIKYTDLEYIQNEEDKSLVDTQYSNNTDNDKYAFKIHDFKLNYNNILSSNLERPFIKHFAYNINKKSMDTTTLNLEDEYQNFKLNTKDMSSLQHTQGERYDVDAEIFLGEQKLQIENVFVKNNKLEVVVPGNFKYNAVGKLIKVNLKGNPIMTSSSIEGDIFHSGTYFVNHISDRYVGDKLIQKMTLNRVDFQTPRTSE